MTVASCGPQRCDYCGGAPCIGNGCPDPDDEDLPDDRHFCVVCGQLLRFPDRIICRDCARDEVTGEGDYWEIDP